MIQHFSSVFNTVFPTAVFLPAGKGWQTLYKAAQKYYNRLVGSESVEKDALDWVKGL